MNETSQNYVYKTKVDALADNHCLYPGQICQSAAHIFNLFHHCKNIRYLMCEVKIAVGIKV